MAPTTRKTAAAAKPETPAASYARQKSQAELIRLVAFLVLVSVFIIPRIPSPIMGVDWWESLRPSLFMLWEVLPPEPIALPVVGAFPQRPILQWLIWALAAFLAFLAGTLIMHLSALYAQRTRPLLQERTYLRLLVPADPPGKSADAVTLLKALHGMAPPTNPMQPTAPPLMLCWTARPDQKVQQGVSVAGPQEFTTAVQMRLVGIRSSVRVEAIDDPLLAELKPGRCLCVAQASTVAGSGLPIAVVGREQTLLAALLPAMATQAGVAACGVRLVTTPLADRRWRLDVLVAQERAKGDAGTEEQQALKAKAAGPAMETTVWIMAVADDPQAGTMQVKTIGAVLAGTAQAVGNQQQRLQLGPVQVLPAVVASPPPFPKVRRQIGLALGGMIAIVMAFMLWLSGAAALRPLLWGLPPLVLWLPFLMLAAHWRKRTDAELPRRHAAIVPGLPPPRNPRIVPIWWPWLGR